MRGVYLEISKAFDEVWHDGLLYKSKAYGVQSETLSLLRKYLQKCKKRVALNGQISEWREIISGVPKGLLLGPLLLLVYINDLPTGIISLSKFFTDDTSFLQKFEI